MTKHVNTTIRYDGPALAGHEMDVQDLAPALLALAEIAKIANRKFNGDRASIRVLVNADTEQQCFQLDLSLVQSWLDHASIFIGKDNVATAAQIAQIIGLAGPPAGGLFWLYKKIYGKPQPEDGQEQEVTFQANTATGTTIINIWGDGNKIEVSNETAQLAQDPKVLAHIKTVLDPLSLPDYEDFSILHNQKPLVKIDRDEARNIQSKALPLPSEIETENFVSMVDGQVEIVTAQYKGNAQWGLWWTGRTRMMKIEDERWLAKFQAGDEPVARPGAWLDVSMEITQPRNKTNPPSFAVKKVKGVIPPAEQGDLLNNLSGN
jgi:hypothetical protein